MTTSAANTPPRCSRSVTGGPSGMFSGPLNTAWHPCSIASTARPRRRHHTAQAWCTYARRGAMGHRSLPSFDSVREAGGAHIIAVSEQAELHGAAAAGYEAQQHQCRRRHPPPLSLGLPGAARLPGDTVLHNVEMFPSRNVETHVGQLPSPHCQQSVPTSVQKHAYSGSDGLGRVCKHSEFTRG